MNIRKILFFKSGLGSRHDRGIFPFVSCCSSHFFDVNPAWTAVSASFLFLRPMRPCSWTKLKIHEHRNGKSYSENALKSFFKNKFHRMHLDAVSWCYTRLVAALTDLTETMFQTETASNINLVPLPAPNETFLRTLERWYKSRKTLEPKECVHAVGTVWGSNLGVMIFYTGKGSF